jgi:hypothetical protein
MVASLLVIFSGQILKWQEPASAAAETIHRLLRFCRRPTELFPRWHSPSSNR